MKILDYLKDNILFLDGGMGTLLQEKGLKPGELPERWNLTHPDIVSDIHRAYYDAGSNVVSTNTFGANILKFDRDELRWKTSEGLRNRVHPPGRNSSHWTSAPSESSSSPTAITNSRTRFPFIPRPLRSVPPAASISYS